MVDKGYKDEYGNIDGCNEITCPYCGCEYVDSYRYLPDNGGSDDVSFDLECEDCGKKFHVSFDCFNHSRGFACEKVCMKHDFLWDGDRIYENHDLKYSISKKSRVYKCSECGKSDFRYLKPDGLEEYTKKEIAQWRQKRNQKEFLERNPHYTFIDNPKGKKVTIRKRQNDMWIMFDTDKPEGNSGLFWRILNRMKDYGFSCTHQNCDKILWKEHKYLKRDWLECKAEYHRNGVKLEFYQSIIPGNHTYPEYNSDKYNLLTNKMKVRYRAVINMIEKMVFSVYNADYNTPDLLDWHDYPTMDNYTGKYPGFIFEAYCKEGAEIKCNCRGLDKNKKQIHNGELKYAYNRKGFLISGRVYERCGTYKAMVHNDRSFTAVAPYQCFDYTPGIPVRIENEYAESRIKRLLEKSVKEENYVYAAKLKEIRDRGDKLLRSDIKRKERVC